MGGVAGRRCRGGRRRAGVGCSWARGGGEEIRRHEELELARGEASGGGRMEIAWRRLGHGQKHVDRIGIGRGREEGNDEMHA
jgi:hypothetical protein